MATRGKTGHPLPGRDQDVRLTPMMAMRQTRGVTVIANRGRTGYLF